jgi:hypothetical protein
MDNTELIECARQLAEELQGLPAEFSASEEFVRGTKAGKIFVAEFRNVDCVSVGHEDPPTRGGWPVRNPSTPRVKLTRAETKARAIVWAGARSLARPYPQAA